MIFYLLCQAKWMEHTFKTRMRAFQATWRLNAHTSHRFKQPNELIVFSGFYICRVFINFLTLSLTHTLVLLSSFRMLVYHLLDLCLSLLVSCDWSSCHIFTSSNWLVTDVELSQHAHSIHTKTFLLLSKIQSHQLLKPLIFQPMKTIALTHQQMEMLWIPTFSDLLFNNIISFQRHFRHIQCFMMYDGDVWHHFIWTKQTIKLMNKMILGLSSISPIIFIAFDLSKKIFMTITTT